MPKRVVAVRDPVVSKTPARPPFKLMQLTEKDFRTMSWLWFPYIPLGAATMLFGPGGIGKSTVAANIAAHVTTGEGLPGQKPGRTPQNVLILSAEDDPRVVLGPRLYAAGADLSKVYFGDAQFILDERGIRAIKNYIAEFSLTVVIVDPIVAYMGGKIDMNKMNEVRSVTGALHEIAMDTGTAILIVHHQRKGTEGRGYEKAAGSADFVNATRSVIYFNEGGDGEKYLEHVKTNYGRMGQPIHVEVDDDGIHWKGFVNDVPRGTGTGRPPRARDDAVAFLRTALANGPVPAKELLALAADEDFNERTLNRAKRGVARSFAKRVDGKMKWFWRLEVENENGNTDDEAEVPAVADREDAQDAGPDTA